MLLSYIAKPFTKVMMKKTPNGTKKIPEQTEDKKLKQAIRRLKSDVKSLRNTIDTLKRENEQLQKTLKKSFTHMNEVFDGMPVEEVIKLANKPKDKVLKRRAQTKPTSDEKIQKTREKYKNFGKKVDDE